MEFTSTFHVTQFIRKSTEWEAVGNTLRGGVRYRIEPRATALGYHPEVNVSDGGKRKKNINTLNSMATQESFTSSSSRLYSVFVVAKRSILSATSSCLRSLKVTLFPRA